MIRRSFWFAAAAAVMLVVAAVATAAVRPHSKAPQCATFRVTGKVAQREKLHVDDLRSFTPHTLDVTFQAGSSTQTHHYVGALLTDVLNAAQPQFDPTVKNDFLRFWAEATGSDDYAAIVSWGEIDPNFGGRQVLLAYQEDGNDLCSAGPRLVVPGDLRGGRYVSNVVKVKLGRAGGGD